MPSAPSGSILFDMHGLLLEVRSDDDRALDAVSSRLSPFRRERVRGDGAGETDIRFDVLQSDPPDRPVLRGRPVYDTELGQVCYYEEEDRLFVDCGAVFVDADLSAGRVVTTYVAGCDESLALATHPLLTLPLLEICKRRGMYPLHAAGVVDDGAAVLIPAASGGGKTTLSIALALSGMGFLSDDMVFLTHDSGGIRVLSFPDELDITDSTAGMFPQTSHLVGCATWGGRPKHQLRGEGIGFTPAVSGIPVLLVVPHLTHEPASSMEEMDASNALMEMLPNVLLTEAASSQSHLDILGALAASVRCVRLNLGTDLDAAVTVVRESMQ